MIGATVSLSSFNKLAARSINPLSCPKGARRKSDVLPTQIRRPVLAKTPVLTDDS